MVGVGMGEEVHEVAVLAVLFGVELVDDDVGVLDFGHVRFIFRRVKYAGPIINRK